FATLPESSMVLADTVADRLASARVGSLRRACSITDCNWESVAPPTAPGLGCTSGLGRMRLPGVTGVRSSAPSPGSLAGDAAGAGVWLGVCAMPRRLAPSSVEWMKINVSAKPQASRWYQEVIAPPRRLDDVEAEPVAGRYVKIRLRRLRNSRTETG